MTSPDKKLTYDFIELPDDTWAYAIVTDYVGPHDYGKVVMGFIEGLEPSETDLRIILNSLDGWL